MEVFTPSRIPSGQASQPVFYAARGQIALHRQQKLLLLIRQHLLKFGRVAKNGEFLLLELLAVVKAFIERFAQVHQGLIFSSR